MPHRLWTREEFILALDLYFRIPFGSISKSNPDIIKLANFIKRTPSSVGMRLSNYANCDPNLHAKGLEGGAQQCQPYWDEFANNRGKLRSAAYECRLKLIETPDKNASYSKHYSEWDMLVDDIYNEDFQNIIMKNYQGHCAVTGMKIPQIVIGCHIIPSTINEAENLQASNGIYLNLMLAKAFVDGLIGFDTNYKLKISQELKNQRLDKGYAASFGRYENNELILGDVFAKPEKKYLEWHMDTVFRK